jgi:hypothetical protein
VKHNTHIYLAAKAIELTRQSVDNTYDEKGKLLRGRKKTKERNAAKERQRILQYYQEFIEEATWAPDDIMKDNDPFHIFKLFTDEEFPDHGLGHRPRFEKDGVTYFKFAGGLPYRVDHNAQEIITMTKLRDYNDQFELKQVVYKYLLISHYVSDAHVPMHCDLRDDPPGIKKDPEPSRRRGSGKPRGRYMKSSAHGKLEGLWDDAVTPVALREGVFPRTWEKEDVEDSDYSDAVTFTFKDCRKGGDIRVPIIPRNGLMDFMIDVCIESKKRGQVLFPLADPKVRNDAELPAMTRRIFADAIGNLMAVWRYIWTHCQKET